MSTKTPVLWQIKISHYNEKARWALDYKGVAHKRRSPMPLFGTLPTAWVLTRGTTVPVLRLDGRSIGDSTRIIAALEQRYPDPPLYPSDPEQLARALELEDFFDEQLAPQMRLFVWNETTKQPRVFLRTAMPGAHSAVYAALRPAAGLTATLLRKRFDITEDKARESRRKVIAAMEHLQNELGGRDYLVGDAFSVADLTAATMFTPTVLPPERQYPPTVEAVPAVRELTEELESMPGAQWIHEMFRRHRGASAQV